MKRRDFLSGAAAVAVTVALAPLSEARGTTLTLDDLLRAKKALERNAARPFFKVIPHNPNDQDKADILQEMGNREIEKGWVDEVLYGRSLHRFQGDGTYFGYVSPTAVYLS